MIGALNTEKVGNLTKVSESLSGYQPTEKEADIIAFVKHDYATGNDIQNYPFEELNGMSVIDRMNVDQKNWLAWSPQGFDDPEESWRWSGIRPYTRNKVINMAAHLTSQILYPNIFAQNENQEEDREMAYVMRQLIEYNVRKSDYELTFLYAVIAGLVNPVAYLSVDYVKAYQKIWEGTNSKHKQKEVMDDILSGFQYHLLPADEVLIGNAYQFDIQRQPFIVHKRRISYDDAEAIYYKHENWPHVKVGASTVFNDEDGLFYDVADVSDDNTVLEVRYYNRQKDMEVCFVNGVYLGNPNTEYNPVKHRTNKNKPRYQFAKFGTEPIDAKRFWAYKSLVAKMQNDQELLDREWQMYIDASTLSTYPPITATGMGKVDRTVLTPGGVTAVENANAKVSALNIANPAAAGAVLREVEASLDQSSVSGQAQGQAQNPAKTARESILLQQNMETALGFTGKMIGAMVKDIGALMVDDIIRFQSVGEVREITGGVPDMKYQTFVVSNQIKGGKTMSDVIRFTSTHEEMTEAEKRERELYLVQEAGDERDIYEVNPSMFAKAEYMIEIDYDALNRRNSAFEKALKLETYDRGIGNPFIDQEKLTRDFLLEPLVGGKASEYLAQQANAMGILPSPLGGGMQGGLPQRMTQAAATRETLPI